MDGDNILIILGAGASYDCLSEFLVKDTSILNSTLRPPLTNEIFSPKYFDDITKNEYRDVDGNEIFNKYIQLKSFASRLQSDQRDINFEQKITELYDIYKNPQTTKNGKNLLISGIIDTFYYLQELFIKCSRSYVKNHSNYHNLISRLCDKIENINFVTFNYDFILENAIYDCFHEYFIHSLDDYINKNIKIFKLHGSCNWGYSLEKFFPSQFSPSSIIPLNFTKQFENSLDERLKEIQQNEITKIKNNEILRELHSGIDYFPSMVLPLFGKEDFCEKHFSCPHSHLEMLKQILPKVNKILIIGWAGNEEHFCELLKEHSTKSDLKVIIVDKGNAGKTKKQLENYLPFIVLNYSLLYDEGFSQYLIEEKRLEKDLFGD